MNQITNYRLGRPNAKNASSKLNSSLGTAALLMLLLVVTLGLAAPATASAQTPSTMQNRTRENSAATTGYECRSAVYSARCESVGCDGQMHRQPTTQNHSGGYAGGAAWAPANCAETPTASQPPPVGPERAAVNHFGRDPPVRFQSNIRYESNTSYDPAPGFCIAAKSTAGIPASESWGNPATLARHVADHGADFGASSAEDYANQASNFLQRAQQEGLPTKIDSKGIIRVYDPETNTFGAYNPSGTTRTFYQPDSAMHGLPTNLDYWNAQPGTAPTIIGGQ